MKLLKRIMLLLFVAASYSTGLCIQVAMANDMRFMIFHSSIDKFIVGPFLLIVFALAFFGIPVLLIGEYDNETR